MNLFTCFKKTCISSSELPVHVPCSLFYGFVSLFLPIYGSLVYTREINPVWWVGIIFSNFSSLDFASDFYFKIYLFIYLWLCWVFVSVRGLSPVAASGGHSSSRCAGLSLSRPLPLQSTGSRCAGSVVVAHGLSCSAACGIFPDQGSNPCPLHWQADAQPLCHQGSPLQIFLTCRICFMWLNLSFFSYSFRILNQLKKAFSVFEFIKNCHVLLHYFCFIIFYI